MAENDSGITTSYKGEPSGMNAGSARDRNSYPCIAVKSFADGLAANAEATREFTGY